MLSNPQHQIIMLASSTSLGANASTMMGWIVPHKPT